MTSVHTEIAEKSISELRLLAATRETTLDKTIEDSFPASDPPSTDPAPEKDAFAA